jgi:plastocyanin
MMKHLSALLAVTLSWTAHAQTTYQLAVEDDEFNPSSLTIAAGDHVHIVWDNSVSHDHTFTQVDQATWNVNGDVELPGGYNFGVGTPNPGTDFTITPTSDVWYVCLFHVSSGMKGSITVTGTIGMEEPVPQDPFTLAPNPTNGIVSVIGKAGAPLMMRLYDASGRMRMNTTLGLDRTVDTHALDAGIYSVEFRSSQGILLSRQRLVVAR